MLDPKFIRDNETLIREALFFKAPQFPFDAFLELDVMRRKKNAEREGLYAQRNLISQEIAALKKQGQDASAKLAAAEGISQAIDALEGETSELNQRFEQDLLRIPNIIHSSVPRGDASANVVVREWGKKQVFSFTPQSHVELAEKLDIIDFKRATKITGSNFILFKKQGALLERALFNFMLDIHTQKHGYTEVFPPFLVNRASMICTGQLPKLEDDMYRVVDDLFLIPTAEVPVTNIHRDEVLDESDLPLRYTAYTGCFRREAGSYGKDTRGLVRVHQFDKVEMVKIVKPETSYDELEKLVSDAEEILKLLGLAYRVVALASGDLSFAASKCYDLEVYSPGIDRWLEVSSCSNFEDFQARRGNIRFREQGTKKMRFVHTLNGSGLALPRIVVALLEVYQDEDGSIHLPEILKPYLHGSTIISGK